MLLVLAGTCLGPAANPFESGPIVQDVTDRGARLLIHTAAPCELVLRYGEADDRAQVSGRKLTRRHVFRLEGLSPSTAYRYRLLDSARRVLWRGTIRTAPRPGTGRVRFAAFGDSGKIPWWTRDLGDGFFGIAEWLEDALPGRGNQWGIARSVVRARPDLVLHLGDVVYPNGRRDHYAEAFFLPFRRLLADVPCYPTLGNHDIMTEDGAPFLEAFDLPREPAGGRYYQFARGPVRFFCIDTFTSSLAPESAQRRWLASALRSATEPWLVVFTHRPFLTASRSRNDAENAFLREQVHPLLAQHGVDLVLSGHDHVYQRFEPQDGIVYVVAGGGGKSLYELDAHPQLAAAARRFSFVVVDADHATMRLEAIAEDGVVLDEYEFPRNH